MTSPGAWARTLAIGLAFVLGVVFAAVFLERLPSVGAALARLQVVDDDVVIDFEQSFGLVRADRHIGVHHRPGRQNIVARHALLGSKLRQHVHHHRHGLQKPPGI